MVIADNDTRWNSTYLSITRGIKLYAKIQVFSEIHRDELKEDFLLPSDWAVIRDMQHYLSPFWQCTLDLESKATFGSHGTIWEALPAMEFLLHHLETLKDTVPASNKRIRECILNSWSVMRKYYDLTDKSHSIYAAATLLNTIYLIRKHHNPKSLQRSNLISAYGLRVRWKKSLRLMTTRMSFRDILASDLTRSQKKIKQPLIRSRGGQSSA